MQTLFQKARIALLGNAHELADKVIDLNSTAAIKQHIRDLERGLEGLQDAIAVATGDLTGARRVFSAAKKVYNDLNVSIDFILSDDDPENDKAAAVLETRLATEIEPEFLATKAEFEAAETADNSLRQAFDKLQSTHGSMMANLKKLERLDRQAKANERAAQTVETARRAVSERPNISVDDLAARTQKRADRAAARLAQATSTFEEPEDQDLLAAEVAARLAQRKARLAQS